MTWLILYRSSASPASYANIYPRKRFIFLVPLAYKAAAPVCFVHASQLLGINLHIIVNPLYKFAHLRNQKRKGNKRNPQLLQVWKTPVILCSLRL